MPFLRLLRPTQWIKNLFVFAGLIFSRRLTDMPSLGVTILAFVVFCLVSSLVYVVNDIHDRQEDRLHPRKKRRPIAAGEVSVEAAVGLAITLFILGIGGGWMLDRGLGLVVTAYMALQICYTLGFKHAVILDVISIGVGFVLRAVAGVVVLEGVELSPWLVICTFTLCLFMGFSKRRCELNALAENNGASADKHRKTLSIYTPDLLNHMTTLTAGIAIVSFLLYTIDGRTIEQVFGGGEIGRFGSKCLLYTLPLVVYAIFRFTVLVEHGEVDGPTDVVTRDRPFQIAVFLWVCAAATIVYRPENLLALFEKLR